MRLEGLDFLMRPKDTDGLENSEDPAQTAPWSSLVRVYTVWSRLKWAFTVCLSVVILAVLRYVRLLLHDPSMLAGRPVLVSAL